MLESHAAAALLHPALCALFPASMPIVLVGQFIKNVCCLPPAHVFKALFADVLDHCEWKFGFRCDGLSSAVYSIIQTVCVGIANGVFNLMPSVTGCIPPSVVDGVTAAAQQPDATKAVFVFFFLVLDVITSLVIVFLLSKLDVEKTIDQEQAEIKSRHEAAASEKEE